MGKTELRAQLVAESDEELVERARRGNKSAFGELWQRHFRSGARVARQFTSSLDADDLVAEAYTRIYQRVLAGGGPTGAFRPYLYTTIRNLASSWGAASRDVQVNEIEDFEDPHSLDDPATIALDRTLTARAFRSLPDRWQSVLWYTEVEGMDPHEVAPLMGMTANGVAALSYRAREGLRKAWLQAHVNDETAPPECRWAIARIGDNARNALGKRDSERMSDHLTTCARCSIINEEIDEVGSRLALVMVPIVIGGVAGGTFLSSFGQASTAVAAEVTVPALPETIAGASTAAAGAAGFLTSAAVPAAVVGTVALVVTGSAVMVAPSVEAEAPAPIANSADAELADPLAPFVPIDPEDGPQLGEVTDPASIIDPVTGEVLGGTGSLVDSVLGTITGSDTPPEGHTAPGGLVGTDISLNLAGTGTPGAHISLQALGQVYATTTVDSTGHFTLNATAIPGGLASLDLVQTVDRQYLQALLGSQGLLGSLLGTVDSLINALIQPLTLSLNSAGINIRLLS